MNDLTTKRDSLVSRFMNWFLEKIPYFARKKQEKIELKKKKIREAFRAKYPDVDKRFSDLLNSIGNDSNSEFYRKEASKVFNIAIKTFFSVIEADKRIDKLYSERNRLKDAIKNSNQDNRKTIDKISKSKKLIDKIDKEANELKNYIANANSEINSTGYDFVNITTEIELSKNSGCLADLAILSSRSESLSKLATNAPNISGIN